MFFGDLATGQAARGGKKIKVNHQHTGSLSGPLEFALKPHAESWISFSLVENRQCNHEERCVDQEVMNQSHVILHLVARGTSCESLQSQNRQCRQEGRKFGFAYLLHLFTVPTKNSELSSCCFPSIAFFQSYSLYSSSSRGSYTCKESSEHLHTVMRGGRVHRSGTAAAVAPYLFAAKVFGSKQLTSGFATSPCVSVPWFT